MMLAPGIPLNRAASRTTFDPERWQEALACERTAFRGLAASALLAATGRALCEIEMLPRAAWRDGGLVLKRWAEARSLPLLPFAQDALRLMDAAGVGSEGEALFTTESGNRIPKGNLLMQINAFGRHHRIAENLASNLRATFVDAVGDGLMADNLAGRKAPSFDMEEERAFLEAHHPLARMTLPAVPAPEPDTPLARALACRVRRDLDEEARERVRLAEFPELYDAWLDGKLDAKRFSMYLGLDNVHRWIRSYRKSGRKGLLQKHPSPARKKAFIVDLRRQRGCEESEAAFRRHLESEHDIVVSESWLAKVLAEAKLTSRLRLSHKAWREKVVEIYRLHAPVVNFSRFWRDVLRDGHGYPYTVGCARDSVEAAGFALVAPGRDPASMEERRRLVIRLFKLHSPVPRLDVFLGMLREKHSVAMTLKALRDTLDEAGLRPKQIRKSI